MHRKAPYGPNGTLLWTDDLNGANVQAWLTLAADVLDIDRAKASPNTKPDPAAASTGRS